MTIGALPLITYVWHYVVARLVYDQLLRPVIHGHGTVLLMVCAAAVGGFVMGWLTRRVRPTSRRRS